ncbi:hypothetical protein [Streptococcus suis]|uniref:hypothetical protein n=1 Tax=Streptococcus suis TaxID=1307 RepID=UPI0038B8DF2E
MKKINKLLEELEKLMNNGMSLKVALEGLKRRYNLSDDEIEELEKEHIHRKFAKSIRDLSDPGIGPEL